VLQGCYRDVTGGLNGCCEGFTKVLQGCVYLLRSGHNKVTELLQECNKGLCVLCVCVCVCACVCVCVCVCLCVCVSVCVLFGKRA
jgi:virulence-associated protein VapD